MSKDFVIKEVKPNVFLFEFKHHYDMCMYFLRYQEYYESSSPKFRGKAFDLLTFMKWYSAKYGAGAFTYAIDWNGFNIPGDIINKVCQLGLPDQNFYDREMLSAWNECNTKSNGNPFYIIGVVKGNGALNHEIAHALFYLYPEYKKEMTKKVKELDPTIKATLYKLLKKLGYTPKVYVDEAQAYLATGLPEDCENSTQWVDDQKVFSSYFKKFLKSIK